MPLVSTVDPELIKDMFALKDTHKKKEGKRELTLGHLSPSPIGNLNQVDDQGYTGQGTLLAILLFFVGGVSG